MRTSLEILMNFKRIERELQLFKDEPQIKDDFSLKYEIERLLRNLDIMIEQLQKK